MNPAERTKEALLARSESLCNAIYDDRNPDPYGGDGYLSTILRAARLEEKSEHATVQTLGEARDFATSAQKELTIRDQATGLVKTTQDLSTLIRDLQELWLFGGLDTLSNPANEEASQAKAVKVAEMVARLAMSKPGEVKQDGMAVKGEER